MKLYCHPLSTFARRVRMQLIEKQAAVEEVLVHAGEDFGNGGGKFARQILQHADLIGAARTATTQHEAQASWIGEGLHKLMLTQSACGLGLVACARSPTVAHSFSPNVVLRLEYATVPEFPSSRALTVELWNPGTLEPIHRLYLWNGLWRSRVFMLQGGGKCQQL